MKCRDANVEAGRRFISRDRDDRAAVAWEVARIFRSRVGHLAEFGVVAPRGIHKAEELTAVIADDADERIP
ncbi:MAG: hypothetical protein JWL84_575 [Rhodospirillales bacterium]|nr:hypothetical protein [Rhodospirillales bacterium]